MTGHGCDLISHSIRNLHEGAEEKKDNLRQVSGISRKFEPGTTKTYKILTFVI
jgi:hypothetical protein